MIRHALPELAVNQEIPLIVKNSEGRRVIVGRAVVLNEGITAIFDGEQTDSFVKSIVTAITKGAINALSLAPQQASPPMIENMERE